MDSFKKPAVAVYTNNYLTVSMTFIYRQMKGVSDCFGPIVLTAAVNNLNLFPFDSIYLKKVTFLERVVNKLYRILSGRSTALTRNQLNYWQGILKKNDVKLIHAHFGPGGIMMLPLARDLSIPLIVTFHGVDASSFLRDKNYLFDLKELFDYAHIITVSNLMANRLKEFGADPSKMEVHYIGIPLDDFKYTKRVPVIEKVRDGNMIEFIQVSNFVEKKGHKITIAAFRNFLKVYPNSRLILAGDGPLRKEIEALCARLDIKEKVEFKGQVSKEQVIPLMEKSDIFLHHSVTAQNGDQEGIPTVIMEAMATGLIVISTFHSGIPELVDDGISGYLVEEKNINSYTKTMIRVLDCDNTTGENAYDRIRERFNMEIQNIKLKGIYRKMLY